MEQTTFMRMSPLNLSKSLSDTLYCTIVSQLTVDEGVVDKMVRLYTLNNQVQNTTMPEIVALISAQQAVVDETQASVKVLASEISGGNESLSGIGLQKKQSELRELEAHIEHQQKIRQELGNLGKMKSDNGYLKEQQGQGQEEINNAADAITQSDSNGL